MRLFIALGIPGEIRSRLADYIERVRSHAADARWARVEGLHVTLKFIGEVKDTKLEEIKSALAVVKSAGFEVTFGSIGFFPNPKSPRVFWAGVESGDQLTQLASSIDAATEKIGIEREKRSFSPHLTLARAGTRDPHSLKALTPLLAAEEPPQFGTMTAHDFWLYRSQLGPGGAKYTKLQRYGLG
ncbi:MAG TPA: RNA 2',3'-cyclic phosphodiesterase [Candidatus Angelobacter sp.]|nr:RNA 2',3'-cyclic phosphodiesterase [Candidatus Angelobacter sp.]